MTGRYQYRLRGAAEEPINSRSRGSTTLGLPPEHPTLPSLLKDGGYRTALDRQVAPGLSARVRPAALGLRGILRADVGRRRLLHATAIRSGAHDLWYGEEEQPRGRLPHRPDLAPRGRLHRAHGARRASAPFFLSLHYTAPHWPWETRDDEALGAGGEGQPVPPARRQHPHLPPHDPPHGRGHRLGHGRAAPRTALARRHAGRLHQRQRRRALLRQLAAGRRQDGPDRRRHPRAVDRALAGA